jgi:hypothetical protein
MYVSLVASKYSTGLSAKANKFWCVATVKCIDSRHQMIGF